MTADDTRELGTNDPSKYLNDRGRLIPAQPGSARIALRRSDVMDAARDELGMTWQEVADKADISPQALRKIRSGDAMARPQTLRQLEFALQLRSGALSSEELRNHPDEVSRREEELARREVARQRMERNGETRPAGRVPEAYIRVDGRAMAVIEFKARRPIEASELVAWTRLLQRFADQMVEERERG